MVLSMDQVLFGNRAGLSVVSNKPPFDKHISWLMKYRAKNLMLCKNTRLFIYVW